MKTNTGIILVLCTALVSGVSVFLNSFAVQQIDPFNLTFIRNSLVAIMLFSIIILIKEYKHLEKLNFDQWKILFAIGLIGGSIPFLLFFYALKSISSTSAGFIHKTLFIYVAFLAMIFLKEKLSLKFWFGALLVFLGNLLLFSGDLKADFPFLLVFAATILWAIENVISKYAIKEKEISPNIVAFGRMFFGSIFMLIILSSIGAIKTPTFEITQWLWLLATTALLFLYVLTYYNSLKYIEVSKASAIIMLAQPITALLSLLFLGKNLTLQQGIGLTLMVIGVILIIGFQFIFQNFSYRGSIVAQKRN
ncbi:MAG: DMT family transporter [Candidatus Diapherotrites archaeon]